MRRSVFSFVFLAAVLMSLLSGGLAFARPVVTLLRMPRAGRKQSAYARTWHPDGLNPLALPDTVDAALAAATRQYRPLGQMPAAADLRIF